ncbi:iron uptake porin [Spirulina subsalsa]|uniref:iron uptake porin n=1 Tax=Spirulina subsalsa TaxID=54311 RepID=UPI0002E85B0F|nr:iron uptake porin [Spirulina subsalsa]
MNRKFYAGKVASSTFLFTLLGAVTQMAMAQSSPEAISPYLEEDSSLLDAVTTGGEMSQEGATGLSSDAQPYALLPTIEEEPLTSLDELERDAGVSAKEEGIIGLDVLEVDPLAGEEGTLSSELALEEIEEDRGEFWESAIANPSPEIPTPSPAITLDELETQGHLAPDLTLSPQNPEDNHLKTPPSQAFPTVHALQNPPQDPVELSPTVLDSSPDREYTTPLPDSLTLSDAEITFEGVYQAAIDGNHPIAQFTPASQFRDVSPTDWAYEALMDLTTRYGCLSGYPDNTFRGTRPLTRYEFAAGLNACIQYLERLIAQQANAVTLQDLEVMQRLVTEFQADIDTLATRVDSLEGRVAFLEENQFSTTTKLFGQAVIGIQGRSPDNDFDLFQNRLRDQDTKINVIHNAQLSLFTQFSPFSLLLTSFQMGDGNTGRTFTNTLGNYVSLGYEGDTDNSMLLSDLNYRHLIANRLAVIVGPMGVSPTNVFRGVNRIESAGSGPLSRFAQRNPIINVGSGQGGLGIDWQVSDRLSFQAVYSTGDPENSLGGGLFGGENGSTILGGQLVVSPTDNIDLSLQYVNAYTPILGSLRTGVGDDLVIIPNADNLRAPMTTDAFGGALEFRVTPQVALGGWVGYTTTNYKVEAGSVQTLNWMAFLRFSDLLGQGNVAGLYVGQPPKITSSNLPDGRNVPTFLSLGNPNATPGGQPSTTTHVELFYRFRVSDNVSVTPGVIVIFNPLQNSANDTITIGALRTTFNF